VLGDLARLEDDLVSEIVGDDTCSQPAEQCMAGATRPRQATPRHTSSPKTSIIDPPAVTISALASHT